jgi:hypothetical protein
VRRPEEAVSPPARRRLSALQRLDEKELEKVAKLIKEVREKTTANKKFADEYEAPHAVNKEEGEVDPNDIPF